MIACIWDAARGIRGGVWSGFRSSKRGFGALNARSGSIARWALLLMAWLAASTAVQAAGASYVYDEIGRLVQVIAPDGTSTQYTYDAAGNITAVRADGTSLLAITSFYPEVGSSGGAVTITGSGFSTTASNNTVTFNGTAATVGTATATQLTVAIPAGATTGPITVSNTNGSVTSTRVFTVGTGSVPQIASFSPNIGNPGTAVTITGQNFSPVPSADHVAFNTMNLGAVTVASATSLTATLPSAGSSGKIRVSTTAGSFTSAADFLAVPSNLSPANVLAWKRGSVGGAAQTLAVTASQGVGAILFDGTVNQLVSMDLTGSTAAPAGVAIVYEVYGPQGTRVANGSLSTVLPTATFPPLTAPGTYAIFLEPAGTTASLQVALKSDTSFTIDGGRYQINGLYPGSTASVSFTGTAGQNLGLGLSGLTFTAMGGRTPAPVTLQVTQPSGAVWQTNTACAASNPGGGCDLNLSGLPATGTYLVQVINPAGNGPVSAASLTLSSDKTGTMAAGTPFAINLRTGQNGRPLFAGTAGQTPTLWIASRLTTPTGQNVPVTVLNPDGSTLTTLTLNSSIDSTYVNLPTLGTTGNYTLFFDPAYGAAASIQATLNPNPVALTVDGNAANIAASAGGYGTFSGTAGQNVGLGVTGLAFLGGVAGSATLQVVKPDGTVWLSTPCAGVSCQLTLANLPATGTYKIQLTSSSTVVTNATVSLSSDKVATLSAGSAYTLTLRAGQVGRLNFAGTAGAPAGIRFETITTVPVNQTVSLAVLDPNGTTIASSNGSTSGNGGEIYLSSLPSNGTYTVVASMTGGASLSSMAVKLNGTTDLTVDVSAAAINSAASGYGTSLNFNGTAGQHLGLAINGIAFAGGSGAAGINIIRPDGSSWPQSAYCSSGNPGAACSSVLDLTQTGTYLLQVTNGSPAITGGTVTLSSDKADALTAGTPYTLNLRWGQNSRLSFAGTAGQAVTVRFAGMTTNAVNQTASFWILDASGNQVSPTARGSTSTNGGVVYVGSLPATGTYYVRMVPDYGAQTQATVTLNPAPELPVDGTPANITSPAAGYGTSLTFNGSAGQHLGLAINGIAFSGGSGAAGINIIRPDGSSWPQSAYCSSGNPGAACSSVLDLTQTGTYLLQVTNGSPAITGGTVTLSSDKADALTAGTPYTLNLRWGQNSRLSFAGTAGQAVTVRFAGMTTNAVNQTASFWILDASGNQVSPTARGSTSTNGGVVYVGSLPTTGTYYVRMVPDYGAQTQATVTLNPAPELPVDGTPANITSSAAGYGTSLTFSGGTGQHLGVAINGIAFTGGSGAAGINIIRPDGSSWPQSAYCSSGNPGAACSSVLDLTQTGTYLLQVTNGSPAITGGTVTLSSDKTGSLVVGSPDALVLRWGQNARLTFVGTAAPHTLSIGTPSTTPAGLSIDVSVYDAGGNQIADGSFTSAGSLNLGTLTTGAYTVRVIPSYGAPTNVTLTYQ
jgi:YD repeat-containing protein